MVDFEPDEFLKRQQDQTTVAFKLMWAPFSSN